MILPFIVPMPMPWKSQLKLNVPALAKAITWSVVAPVLICPAPLPESGCPVLAWMVIGVPTFKVQDVVK